MKKEKLMTRDDASRIQRSTCKQNDGITPKGSFASRAMSAAYRHEPLSHDIELRPRTSRRFDSFEEESESKSDNLKLALGLGALAVGAGLTLFAASKAGTKKEEPKSLELPRQKSTPSRAFLLLEEQDKEVAEAEPESCCEKYCLVM